MIDQSDHPNAIKSRYKIHLKQIFDDLTAMYDRAETVELKENLKERDIEQSTLNTILVISSFWNLPQNIILRDYLAEKRRQAKNEMNIPDIPTYQIRFALEEGSWIVLIREYFRKEIKDQFSRLLTLEELIWETGKGKEEDLAYYLIELDQIGKIWVESMFHVWREEHDFGKIQDLAPQLVAATHNVTYDRGQVMLNGAKRLMKAKLNQLSKIEEIDYLSSWSQNALDIYSSLKMEIDTDELSRENQIRLITLAIFQREIIDAKHKSKRSTNIQQDPEMFLDEIGWHLLDPANQESIDKFTENILYELFNQPEEDPTKAATNILRMITKGIGINSKKEGLILNDMKTSVEDKIRHVKDKIEKQSKRVDLIKETLPKLIIDLKESNGKYRYDQISTQEFEKHQMWDSFEENLLRINRLDDPDIAENITLKAVKSGYFLLIENNYTPKEAVDFLLNVYANRFPDQTDNSITDEIKSKVDQIQDETDELSRVDNYIIDEITMYIFNQMLSN